MPNIKGFATSVLDMVAWGIILIGVVTAATMAVKKNVMGALITIAVTALAASFCFNPTWVVSLGNAIAGLLGLGS